MTQPQRPRPEYLSRRQDENPNSWSVSTGVPLISSVLANAKLGQLIAPNDPTRLGKLLRTFALVQARYDFTDPVEVAKQQRVNERDLQIARVWWTQHLTNLVLDVKRDAWIDGTGSALAEQVSQIPIEQAFSSALPHLMTQQARAILRTIGETNKDAVKALNELRKDATVFLETYMSKPSTEITHTRRVDGSPCRRDENLIVKLCEMISAGRERYEEALRGKPGSQVEPGDENNSTDLDHFKAKLAPQFGDGSAWHDVVLAPLNLKRKHVGKIGTKRTSTDRGRAVRYPSRLMTDPQRRIYGTKGRGKSALVVLDMSGSMDYTPEELDEMIESARGAVVLGYSGTGGDSPNVWILAKDGHRVEELPDVPGGNDCDGSAFQYALDKYRKSSSMPVIWVSDGDISGTRNYSTGALARDMIDKLRQARAIHCLNSREAIHLIDKMSRGHRVAPQIHAHLYEHAQIGVPQSAREATIRSNDIATAHYMETRRNANK